MFFHVLGGVILGCFAAILTYLAASTYHVDTLWADTLACAACLVVIGAAMLFSIKFDDAV
jgi:hypothetical protein